jgi:hypothetical protein
VVFGGIGFALLARQNGWWWQLREWWKQWQAQRAADRLAGEEGWF